MFHILGSSLAFDLGFGLIFTVAWLFRKSFNRSIRSAGTTTSLNPLLDLGSLSVYPPSPSSVIHLLSSIVISSFSQLISSHFSANISPRRRPHQALRRTIGSSFVPFTELWICANSSSVITWGLNSSLVGGTTSLHGFLSFRISLSILLRTNINFLTVEGFRVFNFSAMNLLKCVAAGRITARLARREAGRMRSDHPQRIYQDRKGNLSERRLPV